MTRGGGTSAYPLGNVNTPRSQGSGAQSDNDKNSEVLHVGDESSTHTVRSFISFLLPP